MKKLLSGLFCIMWLLTGRVSFAADASIVSLPELTSPALSDWLAIVDVSETPDITKKIQAQYLITTAYYPDATEADQGAATVGGNKTVKDFVDAIGASSTRTIILKRGSTGNNTDYTFLTSETIPANITLAIEPGARCIDAGGTANLVIGKLSDPGLNQVFNWTGSGVINLTNAIAVSPCYFGFAETSSATINTAALQRAISSQLASTTFGLNELVPGNLFMGCDQYVELPEGKFDLNDQVVFGYFTSIKSDRKTILNQTNNSKNIFYSESMYKNTFEGISFVGGATQIFAQNGATGVVGQEGGFLNIKNCDFTVSHDMAIKIFRSGAGGGAHAKIADCSFYNCVGSLYSTVDVCYFHSSWIGIYPQTGLLHPWPNDCAQIKNGTFSVLYLDGIVFIPGDPDIVLPENTNRWIDNYYAVYANNCRFGGEFGGAPCVYNFTNAFTSPIYPYLTGGTVSIKNSSPNGGASTKNNNGIVVLKSGIPNTIIVEDNYYHVEQPVIRTNLLTGGITLANYFASISPETQPMVTIKVKNNTAWGEQITGNSIDTKILQPYLEFSHGLPALYGNEHKISNLSLADVKIFTYQNDAFADEASIDLPTTTSGFVLVSCNDQTGVWVITQNGLVAKGSGTVNAVDTDTDNKFCVFQPPGALYARIKNRLGYSTEIRVSYFYN